MKLARPRPGSARTERLSFDMLISDFGPIKKASISLRPLTIFIGGNDMGKSYAAMLAHSVMSTERGLDRRAYTLARSAHNTRDSEMIAGRLAKVLGGLEHADEAACPPSLAAQIARSCVDEYQVRLQREIIRNFGSELAELARSGAGHFSMTLKEGERRIMSYKKNKLGLSLVPKSGIKFRLSSTIYTKGLFQIEWSGDGLYCKIDPGAIPDLPSGHSFLTSFYVSLKSAMLQRALADLPSHSRYFPAARSGILQAHRVIASNIVRNAPYAGIKDIHVPRLSGVVSDFVSTIIDMHPAHGDYYDVGEQIEKDIFGGHVMLKYAERGAIPEIFCERSTVSVPIHRTSSTISELAPFTLHLKHHAEGHGVLIIEEPEAHLHPRNQSLLAGHIVRLVRAGANIIITTHSSTLFESISQYLRASRLRPEGRKNALGSKDLYLLEDEIAPHLFKMDGGGGSVVEKIDLSAEDGIEQDVFVREDRMLNETNLRIEENEG